MAGLTLSTTTKVIIACAGAGTRMQEVHKDLHKGLLPYEEAPILWHIISHIPTDVHVLLLTGHKSRQIRSLLPICFPHRQLDFIEITDYFSEESGTAKSLIAAEPFVSDSFWYIPCDAVFDDELEKFIRNEPDENTIFVSDLSSVEHPEDFTTIESSSGRVNKIQFKGPHQHLENAKIFTGLMFVKDSKSFMNQLKHSKFKEFVPLLDSTFRVSEAFRWKDFGTPIEYFKNKNLESKYDFSKPHEITYVLPEIIVKYFEDKTELQRKKIKPKDLPSVYPSKVGVMESFFHYEKIRGQTLYGNVNEDSFQNLLIWLRAELWKPTTDNVEDSVHEFYVEKTLKRIDLIKHVLPYDFNARYLINDKHQLCPSEVLKDACWEDVLKSVTPGKIHGDLQFDNIVQQKNGEFRLIDWRTSFGNCFLGGDIHYDLAKLLGGIRMNYSEVKKGNFFFENHEFKVDFNFPSCKNQKGLESVLERFCMENGYDWVKIEKLVAMIYLNMSPLHSRPFSDLLFFHGCNQLLKRNANVK
jgi:choline kinase